MDDNLKWSIEKKLARCALNLEKNNFEVKIIRSIEEAVESVKAEIEPGFSVAFGGSATVNELGIIQSLKNHEASVLYTKKGITREESLQIRRDSIASDIYIASPNAVTLDGRLVFLDSIGNRAAGMLFGHKKIIAIAGCNKICSDIDKAWDRAYNIAAPANAKRLDISTPCAETGVCANCQSPDRICNIEIVLRKKPNRSEYKVFLLSFEAGY